MLFNTIIIGVPFVIFWGVNVFESIQNEAKILINKGFWTFLLVWSTIYLKLIAGFIIGIILHELLHAFVFLLFAEKGFQSLKFGFIEKPFIPYVHCSEAIPVWAYRISILMPGMLLGILPSIAGIFTGSLYTTLFGLFFTGAAAGDVLLFKSTLAFDGNTEIHDLAEDMGFEIITCE